MLQRSMMPGSAGVNLLGNLGIRIEINFLGNLGSAQRGCPLALAAADCAPLAEIVRLLVLGHLGNLGYGKNVADFRRPYI
jgi:hypothetical protein